MVNFMLIEREIRSALSQTISDEKLEMAITHAIRTALAVYDREKEQEKKQKHF